MVVDAVNLVGCGWLRMVVNGCCMFECNLFIDSG